MAASAPRCAEAADSILSGIESNSGLESDKGILGTFILKIKCELWVSSPAYEARPKSLAVTEEGDLTWQ